MPFYMPKLLELFPLVAGLRKKYESAHEEKQSQRFFVSRVLTGGPSPARYSSIQFIENLAKEVSESKSNYRDLDPNFRGKDYAKDVAPFLKKVIVGSLWLELILVDGTYSAHPYVYGQSKDNSALAATLLKTLGIDDLDSLSEEDKLLATNCLEALKQYIVIVARKERGGISELHPTKNNDELLKVINEAISLLPTFSSRLTTSA